jgi:hypothetical protein
LRFKLDPRKRAHHGAIDDVEDPKQSRNQHRPKPNNSSDWLM